jgi:hypothetical protein
MGVPRKRVSIVSCSARTRIKNKTGTQIRQQFVHFLLLWNTRFLRNSAPACLEKGVRRPSTRRDTSALSKLTAASSSVSVERFWRLRLGTRTVTLTCEPDCVPAGTGTCHHVFRLASSRSVRGSMCIPARSGRARARTSSGRQLRRAARPQTLPRPPSRPGGMFRYMYVYMFVVA